MIAPPPAPPGAETATGQIGTDTWASITYDVDGPSLAFSRPPFNLDIPLTDDEVRDMGAGVFPEQVEAALAAATLPPARPLTEADWAALGRIAREALDPPPPADPSGDTPPAPGLRHGDPAAVGRAAAPQPVAVAPMGAASTTPGATGPPHAAPPPPPTDGQADRDFTVILEFAARGEGPRQVVISVGGSGRSESFRRCAVDDWREVFLAEVPGAVEAFLDRCREQPVHPAYRAVPSAQAVSRSSPDAEVARAKGGRRGKGTPAAIPPLLASTPRSGTATDDARRADDAGPSGLSPVPPTPADGATPVPPTTGESPSPPADPIEPVRTQLSLLFG